MATKREQPKCDPDTDARLNSSKKKKKTVVRFAGINRVIKTAFIMWGEYQIIMQNATEQPSQAARFDQKEHVQTNVAVPKRQNRNVPRADQKDES